MSDHAGRAFAVQWSVLPQWDALTASLAARFKSEYPLVELGEITSIRWELADESQLASGEVRMVERVSFDGQIYADGKDETKMEQWIARPGDLLISKIRARQGSIGLVSNEHGLVSGSIHYRSLVPDTAKVDPLFAWLTLRSGYCRAQFLAATGGAMKGEISEGRLLSLKIPFPPLATQRAIVAHWMKADDAVQASKGLYAQVSNDLNDWLYAQTNPQAFNASSLAVGWSGLETWNVQNARAAVFKATNPEFVPFATYAEEATVSVRPSLNPEHDWPVYGVNNQDGVFFSHHQKGAEFNSSYKRIQKDWFFHNPTRSAVGSLGHVPEVPDDAITSPEYQIWRLRDLGSGSLQPGFVATLIQTKWFVKVIQFHRVGTVKQRLYVENLLSMPVPRFPRELQKRITAAREKIATERTAAAQLAAITAHEVEEMILGQQPVPGIA